MSHSRNVEQTIEQLAAQQHGAVSRAQLIRAGVPAAAVDRRVAAKRLRILHRGVYAVGPVLSPHVAEMAAVLACGATAVVSHASAARLWELLPSPGKAGPVEVSISAGDHSRRPRVRVHRVLSLPRAQVTRVNGIPVTTVARTLCDIAVQLPEREFERALAAAFDRGLTDRAALQRLVGARHRSGRLRGLLRAEAEPRLTRSHAEEQLLALIRKAQLVRPVTNMRVHGHEVDFYWKAERLAVEIDGFAFHSSRRMFESDRRRDAILAAAGVRVIRVTWHQLGEEPETVIARLAQALIRAAG